MPSLIDHFCHIFLTILYQSCPKCSREFAKSDQSRDRSSEFPLIWTINTFTKDSIRLHNQRNHSGWLVNRCMQITSGRLRSMQIPWLVFVLSMESRIGEFLIREGRKRNLYIQYGQHFFCLVARFEQFRCEMVARLLWLNLLLKYY